MPWQIGGFTRGNLEHSNILSYMPDGNSLKRHRQCKGNYSSHLLWCPKPIMSIWLLQGSPSWYYPYYLYWVTIWRKCCHIDDGICSYNNKLCFSYNIIITHIIYHIPSSSFSYLLFIIIIYFFVLMYDVLVLIIIIYIIIDYYYS